MKNSHVVIALTADEIKTLETALEIIDEIMDECAGAGTIGDKAYEIHEAFYELQEYFIEQNNF